MRELAGLREVIGLILRRERVALPIWILILGLLPAGVASGFVALYPTEAELAQAATTVASNPALVAFLGEVQAPTLGGMTVWRMGAMLAVVIGIVNVLTVTRHTRAEEQSGRRELIASTVLGRHAPLVAALVVVGAADLLIGSVVAAGMIGFGVGAAGAIAFGLAMTAVGWVFAGIAAVMAQLAESSRTANGLGLAIVAAAFLLRVIGDAGKERGLEILSWISPIGLAQRVRAFAEERWWLLVVMVAVAIVFVVASQALSSRRDVGAGVLTIRAGSPVAARGLSGPFGLAVRLQRWVALSWIVGFAVFGALIGLATDAFGDLVGQNPTMAAIFENLGGQAAFGDAFVAAMLSMFGIAAAAHAIQAVLWLRSEEVEGRTEEILATPVTRPRWLSSHLAVGLALPVLDMLATGAASGLTYGLVIGDPGQVGRVAFSALVQIPAVWLVAGVGLAVYGLVPHLSRLVWSLLGIWGILTIIGTALGLDQWLLNLSPFSHLPSVPGAAIDAVPLGWMLALAAALIAVGFGSFRRRDVEGV